MRLFGRLVITTPGGPRKTAGRFGGWMRANHETLRRHFGVDLVPGSLNVLVEWGGNLGAELDAGRPSPALVIPHAELREMAPYLGDAQAWRANFSAPNVASHECWVLRRIGSQVPRNVLEIVSAVRLVMTYHLRDGDDVQLLVFDGGRTFGMRAV